MVFYTKKKTKNPTKPYYIFLIGNVGTRNVFTLSCIIQTYYDITNVDPLKPKVMKLTYTRKVTFNINGRTIHFALAISLNKILTKLNALNDEKCDNFI